MDLKEFIKIRADYLKSVDELSTDLPTAIRINAKLQELTIIAEFLVKGETDNLFKIR